MAIEKKISRLWLRIDGELIETVAGSVKFSAGGYERAQVIGDHGVVGYTEKPVPMTCEGSVIVGSGFNLTGFVKNGVVELIAQYDTGQIVTSSGCWFTKPLDFSNDGSGSASFALEGNPLENA